MVFEGGVWNGGCGWEIGGGVICILSCDLLSRTTGTCRLRGTDLWVRLRVVGKLRNGIGFYFFSIPNYRMEWFDHPPVPMTIMTGEISPRCNFIVLQFIFDAFDAYEFGFENCRLKLVWGVENGVGGR